MKLLKIQNYCSFLFVFLISLLGLGMVGEVYGLERRLLRGQGVRGRWTGIKGGENDCAKPQGVRRLVGLPNG
jgi:hypothetical protein